MPPITDDELRDLRQKYHCAYTAHQSCMRARSDEAMSGKPPSQELIRREAAALRELIEARARQLAGWTELVNDDGIDQQPGWQN